MKRALLTLLAAALAATPAAAGGRIVVKPGATGAVVGPIGGGLFNFAVSASQQPGAPLAGPSLGLEAAPALQAPPGMSAAPVLALPGAAAPAASLSPTAQPELPAALDEAPAAALARPAGQAGPAAARPQVGAQALGSLRSAARKGAKAGPRAAPGAGWTAGVQAFDGADAFAAGMRDMQGPALGPAFEPPSLSPAPLPEDAPADGLRAKGPDERLTLSFQPAQKPALLAADPKMAIYAIAKRVRDFDASGQYWNQFKRGVEIDIVSRGEPVFGRPTKITGAVTKPLGQLTREDFAGLVPQHMLQFGVVKLREALRAQLEENRKRWNPNDSPVGEKTKVRVIKFKSFLELYRESHGPDAVPEPEKPQPRAPLKIKAQGRLAPLARFLPRAVYLDLDLLDGPMSQNLLSDMAKLQRTGVYFVGFSRKPGAEELYAKLLKQMSAYQSSVLMPIRFFAATDDGAVLSEFGKGGPHPVDVAAFTPAELEVARDAAQKASEATGVPPKAVHEAPQPAFGRDEAGRPLRGEAPVRYGVALPKSLTEAQAKAWQAAFAGRLSRHGVDFPGSLERAADGRWIASVRKTTLERSLGRLDKQLQDKFGLFLNPGDALVLSHDPALLKAHPELNLPELTGLKREELVENVLGLLLGEHRENQEGDLAGSASRMSQFNRDRQRYMTETIMAQDAEEQNINFFSGHAVHAANDWLVWRLQNGKRPTEAEYEAELRERWNAGLREFKPVGLPAGEDMEGWLRESVRRGLSMYKAVVRAHGRGEILIGTEIPNFFVVKDYQRRSGELRRRYFLHTIFDFVALRLSKTDPGHATLVIYDFKTGPAKSRRRLDKDLQVLTYALFAHDKWVGEKYPTPYLSGTKGYHIDDAKVEFIYNAVTQPTEINPWDLDRVRAKIISTLNRIHSTEARMLGLEQPKKAKGKAGKGKAARGKKAAKAAARTKKA